MNIQKKKFFAIFVLLGIVNQFVFAAQPFSYQMPEINYPKISDLIEPPQEFILKINCAENPGDFGDSTNPCLKLRKQHLTYTPRGVPQASLETPEQLQNRLKSEGYTKDNALPLYLRYFFNLTVIIAIIICIIVLIYGGVLYLVSTGKPATLKEARTWMQAALTGLIIILAAYAILYTINPQLTFFKPLIKEEFILLPGGGILSKANELNYIPLGQILERTIDKLTEIRERAATTTAGPKYVSIKAAIQEIAVTLDQLETSLNDLEKISQTECACGNANCIQQGDKYVPDPNKPCNPDLSCKQKVKDKMKEVESLKEKLRVQTKRIILLEIPLVIDYLDLKIAGLFMSEAENLLSYNYLAYIEDQLGEAGATAEIKPLFSSWPKANTTSSGSIYVIKNQVLLASSTNPQNATTVREMLDIIQKIINSGEELDEKRNINTNGLLLLKDHPTSTSLYQVVATNTAVFLQEASSTISEISKDINNTDGLYDLSYKLKDFDNFGILREISKINLILGYYKNRIKNLEELLNTLRQYNPRHPTPSQIQELQNVLSKIIYVQYYYLSVYGEGIWGKEAGNSDYLTFYIDSNNQRNRELIEESLNYSPIVVFAQLPAEKVLKKYKTAVQKALGNDFLDLSDLEWAEVLSEVENTLNRAKVIEVIADEWSKGATLNAFKTLIERLKYFFNFNPGSGNAGSKYQFSQIENKKLPKLIETAQAQSTPDSGTGDEFITYLVQQYIRAISQYFIGKGVDALTLVCMSMLSQTLTELSKAYPFLNPQAWKSLSNSISDVLNSKWTDLIPQLNNVLNSTLEQLLPQALVDYLHEVQSGIENLVYEAEEYLASNIVDQINNIIFSGLGEDFASSSPFLFSLLQAFSTVFDTIILNELIEAIDVYLVDQMMPISVHSISIHIGEMLNLKLKDILPQEWVNYLNQTLKQSLEQCGTQDCYNIINFFVQAASTTQAISDAIQNAMQDINNIVSSTPNTLAEIFFPGSTAYWNQKTIYQILTENEAFASSVSNVPKQMVCEIFNKNNECNKLCKDFSINDSNCDTIFPENDCKCWASTSLAQISDLTAAAPIDLIGIQRENWFNRSLLQVVSEKLGQFSITYEDENGDSCTTTINDLNTMLNTGIQSLVNNLNSRTICNGVPKDVSISGLVNWINNTNLYDFLKNNIEDATTTKFFNIIFEKPLVRVLQEDLMGNLTPGQQDSLNKFIHFFTTPLFDLISDEQVRDAVKKSTVFDLFSDNGKTPLINLLTEDFRIMVQLMNTYDITAQSVFPQVFQFFKSLSKPWKELLIDWSCQISSSACPWFKLLDKPISWDLLFLDAYFGEYANVSNPSTRFASSSEMAESYYNFFSTKSIADLIPAIGAFSRPIAQSIPLRLPNCTVQITLPDSTTTTTEPYHNLYDVFKAKLGDLYTNCTEGHPKLTTSTLAQLPTSTIIDLIDHTVFKDIGAAYYIPNFNYLLNTNIENLVPIYFFTHNTTSSLKVILGTNPDLSGNPQVKFLCYRNGNQPNLCGLLDDYFQAPSTDTENCKNFCRLVEIADKILNKSLYNNIIDYGNYVNPTTSIRDRFEKSIGDQMKEVYPFSSTVRDVMPDQLCATISQSILNQFHISTSSCSTTSQPDKYHCCVPVKSPLDQFFGFNLRNWATSTIHNIFVNYFKEHPEDLWDNVKKKLEDELQEAILKALGKKQADKLLSTSTQEKLAKELSSTTQDLLKDSLPNVLENGIPLNSLHHLY